MSKSSAFDLFRTDAKRYLQHRQGQRIETIRLLFNELIMKSRESHGYRSMDLAQWLSSHIFWESDSRTKRSKELFEGILLMSALIWSVVWFFAVSITSGLSNHGWELPLTIMLSAIAGVLSTLTVILYYEQQKWACVTYLSKKLRDERIREPRAQMNIPEPCIPAYAVCRDELIRYIS